MLSLKGETMPKNVRNFLLELAIDGRKSNVKTGPVRNGGFILGLKVRDKGEIRTAGDIIGEVRGDGVLTVEYWPKDGDPMTLCRTLPE